MHFSCWKLNGYNGFNVQTAHSRWLPANSVILLTTSDSLGSTAQHDGFGQRRA